MSGIKTVLWLALAAAQAGAAVYDVRSYGARGDGTTLDTEAINKAIEAASAAGGGTVVFPAGTYLSGSIRLKSHIALHLDAGAVIEATTDPKAYDSAEPNQWDKFQDFGHSHWRNSLIWGENLEDISITGPGRLYGKGLTRGERGQNKTIALKQCRNVTLRDFSIFMAGHFGVLATGTDNLTIDNLRIDTNRDGLNIDSCRNVRISNCSINAPNDDAIVLKSTHALGLSRPTEHVTITNCLVAGYDIGSLLDGTHKRTVTAAPDRDGPTGRIKLGTESDGGFRNIAISNIVFDRSRGLAFETVDGGALEDVTVSNITMRDICTAPFFFRIGARMRRPDDAPPGTLRRVTIDNVNVYDADPRYASIIAGIPGHDVEDVRLSNIRILYRGGLTLEDAARQAPNMVNTFFFRGGGGPQPREPFAVPEREKEYPEPSMFGVLPAYGFYIRHARGVQMANIEVGFQKEDGRPAFVVQDSSDISLDRIRAMKPAGAALLKLRGVTGVTVRNWQGLTDAVIEKAEDKEM